ncbi:MAG: hypothetical protein IJ857_03525 [Lachnospiraceae bacterium]|nr:hypothetical protein [Lachnospiraceae bacterium]
MESHISRILSGEFGKKHKGLSFPEEKLELTVFPNEDTEGVFHVHSERKGSIDGMIVSSESRMECDNVKVENDRSEVHFTFRGKGLSEGTVVKGDIAIISEEGEYRLPFSVSVVMKYPESSQGMIKNLFHFTNLARNHFDEAVNLFYSPEMLNIFKDQDRRSLNLYRAFSVYPGSGVNVEEFLIAVHKKSPVIFTTDQDKVEIRDAGELNKIREIKVRKSGWGYTRVNIRSNGSFLRLKKDLLTLSDFNGDLASIEYIIDPDKLHRGANKALITLKSFSSIINIEVNVDLTPAAEEENNALILRRQRNMASLMRDYLDFRIKRTDLMTFSQRTAETCSHMIDEDKRDIVPRLVMTHVYLLEGRDHDADIMLSLIDNEFMLGDIHYEVEGYYDYLKALFKKENVFADEMSSEVRRLHAEHPDSSLLLWFRIYLDKELGDHPEARLELLDRQFRSGSRNPLLYIEVLRALTEKPEKTRINSMSEIHALHWGVKNGIYYEKLVSSILSFSYGLKGYSPVFLEVIKAYYNRFGSLELLEAICTILIRERGNIRRTDDDFRWFNAAVRYGLKITRLYESYLNTAPDDPSELMPESILMYFSIGAGVGNDRMALFYASMIANKDSTAEILKSNEQRIAAFAVKEAENKRISVNHAIIYEYVAGLSKNELSSRFMLAISPLIFCHEITVEDPTVKMVASVENGFNREHSGTVTGGRALISFYGGEYDLITEFDDMRRALAKRGVKDRVLLNPSRFVKAIRYGIEKDPGQAFYVCGSGRHAITVNQVNEMSVRVISEAPDIEKSIRNECYFALLRHYSDIDDFDSLDSILDNLDVSRVSMEVRAEIARLYVSRGMHGKVYSLIKEYGPEGIDPVILVRLLSRMIGEGINTEDPCLINLSMEALRQGKYDENILNFLCSEFHGTIKDLRDVWKASREFGLDTAKIEERILSQMLFAGSFTADRDEILLSCMENGGRERIVNACLDYIAHEYFVEKKIVDDRIFRALLKKFTDMDELSDISSLALIKYYSEDKEDEALKEKIAPLVEKLIRKGVIFDFFREYRDYAPSMALYHDRTFVEYRTGPDRRVKIHYLISDDDSETGSFMELNMEENYPGVYTADFILFFGERLQYYITEEDGETRELTESEELERDLTRGVRTDSRYDMINDMLLSGSVQDDPSLDDLMDQYLTLTETVEEFF